MTGSVLKAGGVNLNQHCLSSETDEVVAQVTEEFLEFTKAHGNDLSTPRPPSFPGLKPGDRWCLCVSRYPHI